MMAWLPSYFADTLSLNLTQAAQLSLLPPVAAIVASSIAGTAGDALVSKGVPVVRVRKLAQCIAFLGPALCLAGASLSDDSYLKVGQSPCQPRRCSMFSLCAVDCLPILAQGIWVQSADIIVPPCLHRASTCLSLT